MKKLVFISLFYWVSQNVNAQAFLVGDMNCNYNLVNKTFSTVTTPTTQWMFSSSDIFQIDIDGDLIKDIDLYSGFGVLAGSSGGRNETIKVTSSTNTEFVYTPMGPGWYNQSIANVPLGTVLNNSLNWKITPSTFSMGTAAPLVYEFYQKNSPYFTYTVGVQINPFYVGFRKILSGNDTIYGWIKMTTNFPGAVYDYAYKQVSNTTSPPASTFVTTATAICIGDSLDLNASPSGGMFSGFGVAGNKFKSGALSTGTYNVYYTMPNPGGCTVASMLTLTVNPLPTISLFNWFYNLCSDDTLEINAYPIGAPFVYSGPGLVGNTFYATQAGIGVHTVSISITDGNGCTKMSNLNIDVNSCVGINELQSRHSTFEVFPNPNNGEFEIKGIKEEPIFIKNELGLLIQTKNLEKENNYSIRINNLQSGVYFVGNKFSQQKVVVIK